MVFGIALASPGNPGQTRCKLQSLQKSRYGSYRMANRRRERDSHCSRLSSMILWALFMILIICLRRRVQLNRLLEWKFLYQRFLTEAIWYYIKQIKLGQRKFQSFPPDGAISNSRAGSGCLRFLSHLLSSCSEKPFRFY